MRTTLENTLGAMITSGWADRTYGDVSDPMGHIALITVKANEVAEITAAHDDVLDFVIREGYWIVTENELGQMTVEEFPSWSAADRTYRLRENEAARAAGEDR